MEEAGGRERKRERRREREKVENVDKVTLTHFGGHMQQWHIYSYAAEICLTLWLVSDNWELLPSMLCACGQLIRLPTLY